ncbi:MAG TPA: sigma-E factor negative regulatory protein [Burkholderiaceae bacterium]|nr:sigma-E factor negative regulatory protein [Burkholderiaceae bacterium]
MKLSSLVDGELERDDAHRTIDRLLDDPFERDRWLTYQAIGDALRLGATSLDDQAFASRMAKALEQEPIHFPPAPLRAEPSPARRWRKAWRQYGAPAVAIAAAVATVSWIALPTLFQSAPATAPVQAAAPLPPTLHEYLFAHQQYAPSTRMQGVAPYVKAASFDRSPYADNTASKR